MRAAEPVMVVVALAAMLWRRRYADGLLSWLAATGDASVVKPERPPRAAVEAFLVSASDVLMPELNDAADWLPGWERDQRLLDMFRLR